MRILLVQQDKSLAQTLIEALERRSFIVEWTNDGTIASRVLDLEDFDAVILDIDVPGKNGYDILYHLKASGNRVPVMVVTARNSLDERVASLNEGADDFLNTGADIAEVEARLYAIIRRRNKTGFLEIRCGPLVYDTRTRTFCLQDRPLALPNREYALLFALIQRVGRTVPKQALFDRVFARHDVHIEALDVIVCRLRKHFTDSPVRIINVRGFGYRLECLECPA